MSIMPEGGWHKLPQLQDDDHGSQNIRPTQSNYLPRRSHLTCKVCDRGTLESKAVYRMSGPAVVIGFILLIPSIIGMVSCALMLLVFNTSVGVALGSNAVAPRRIHQSAEDATFRRVAHPKFLEI